MEPQKPFLCTIPDCGQSFTNEDHLNVHTKKHDMVLQLGSEQKTFVADQTPTPTRFIKNCEEVGLFLDLQHVNPFDEGFKRAMETKSGPPSLDGGMCLSASDDVLHTPQMVFPITDVDSTLYSSTNNQRNITISRSSSDESGAIKEYETTTISKLTNEVTTISRVIGKPDLDKIATQEELMNKDVVNETVSYRNNVIKIQSNVEIRKDNVEANKNPITLTYTDSVIKDTSNLVTKDVMLTDSNKLIVQELPPIMSQKSIDFVVDSLANDTCQHDIEMPIERDKDLPIVKVMKRNYENAIKTPEVEKRAKIFEAGKKTADFTDDYEVIIKLPNQRYLRMKAFEDVTKTEANNVVNTKDKVKKALIDKISNNHNPTVIQRVNSMETAQIVPNVLPMGGTLYPVTIVNNTTPILITNTLKKIPIPLHHGVKGLPKSDQYSKRAVGKRKELTKTQKSQNMSDKVNDNEVFQKVKDDIDDDAKDDELPKNDGDDKTERRSAASRRYRERLKSSMQSQRQENSLLKEKNQRLLTENAALKALLLRHAKTCPAPDELRNMHQFLQLNVPTKNK